MPSLAKRVVHHSVAGLEQIAPHHGDRDERGDDRREEGGAEERLEAGQPELEQQRRAERSPIDSGTPTPTKYKRVAQRLPEQRGPQQLQIVAETDEAQIAQSASA